MQLEFTLVQPPASPDAELDAEPETWAGTGPDAASDAEWEPPDLPTFGKGPDTRWNESTLLEHLRDWGARHLERVAFRANRSTIWSLTRHGTSLNLHQAYRTAPTDIVSAFAVIASEWRRPTDAYRQATFDVRTWPGLGAEMERIRGSQSRGHARRGRPRAGTGAANTVRCVGTAAQRRTLRGAFTHFNSTRLDGLLPADTTLRFSSRMTRRLGQMQGTVARGSASGSGKGARMEIALSIDLLLEGNEHEFVETLLHEMAHAADFVARGTTDHGSEWKVWARRMGCAPRPCTTARVRRRSNGGGVSGVPPGLTVFAGPGGSTDTETE